MKRYHVKGLDPSRLDGVKVPFFLILSSADF